jgi:3-oxoacyl-[acyl-carrier-protein] synthase III
MASFQIDQIRVSAICAAVPAQAVRNPDDERFARHVGITTRRVAPATVCASDLCIRAASELIDRLQLRRENIGALVFVTQTPDYPLPGNSMLAQQALGLSTAACLLDLNQGCAGYVYGVATLASLMRATGVDTGLLLVGDTMTRLLSADDRSTVLLFSDAGSATLLESSAGARPMYFNLGADGAGMAAIQVKGGGARYPFVAESGAPVHLVMRGLDVLHHITRYAEPSIRSVLADASAALGTPDHYVFHQANRVLNSALIARLGIAASQAPETLSEYGNTSCASIPVTLCRRLGERLTHAPSTLLLSGFGSGFSWGSAMIRADSIVCPDVIELDAASVHAF